MTTSQKGSSLDGFGLKTKEKLQKCWKLSRMGTARHESKLRF